MGKKAKDEKGVGDGKLSPNKRLHFFDSINQLAEAEAGYSARFSPKENFIQAVDLIKRVYAKELLIASKLPKRIKFQK